MGNEYKYAPLGDSAFIIKVGNSISDENHYKVMVMKEMLENASHEGIIEVVPAYCDLVVHYDPAVVLYPKLLDFLKGLHCDLKAPFAHDTHTVEIPVLYGGEMGMDLESMAKEKGIRPEEICEIHSSQPYRVYMLGFLPGFPYLGGLDERLHASRLATPRVRIPAGSVGIAGSQTGIYPLESPGGWRILGRTPLKLFNPNNQNPFLLKAGDTIQFKAIDQQEFDRLAEDQGE